MKKIIAVFMAVIVAFSLFGCKKSQEKINLNEFDKLLSKQPAVVVDSELFIQTGNSGDKRFYPDMLTATIQNRTDKAITYLRLAFVAWDKDGKPVKIKAVDDKSGDEIKEVAYKSLNLESGRYYGKGMGINLAPNHNIETFKVIVVSFKTKDGENWENPYYETFKSAFASKKFSKSMMIPYTKQEDNFKVLTQNELKKTVLDEVGLKDKFSNLPIQVLTADYIVTGEDKDATPDTIKATFKNIGEKQISKVTLCFFAFDEAGKAVRIKEAGDNASLGNYYALVEYTTTDFVKDAVFGDSVAYNVHENCGIKYVKAFVKAYTDIDGKAYENPYFIDACLIYEGEEIKVELPTTPEIETQFE